MDETAFAQVTVEAIAERAGASKATVYRWWPNKAAVVIEAFREAVGAANCLCADTGSLREDLTTAGAELRARAIGTRRANAAVVHCGGAQRSGCGRGLPFDLERSAADGGQTDAAPEAGKRAIAEGRRSRPGAGFLYGPLYYRFLVKNEPPSQKYAEALARW